MPTRVLAQATALSDAGKGEEGDLLLADLWDDDTRTGRVVARVGSLGAADNHMREMSQHRRRLLLKARAHHHSGSYEASVPLLLAQVEGITADVAEGRLFFSTSKQRMADVEDSARLVSLPAALPAQRVPFVAGLHETQARGSLSRHGILHGRELAYDTKVISAKCWSLLDAICEWAMPLASAIAVERRAAAQGERAGSGDVNEQGQRLDDREFKETREALRWVSTCQMGHHRKDGRFHARILAKLLGPKDFVRHGLAEEHGLRSQVDLNGQEWWGWRTTVSGWVLALALVALDGNYLEYQYAGAREPAQGPGADPATWGDLWGNSPDWRSLEGV